MISDSSRYYGAVFSYLIEGSERGVHVERIFEEASGFFVLNGSLPIYIKYATKRRGPWFFNFRSEQIRYCDTAMAEFGKCAVVFVCGLDGAVGVDYRVLKGILSETDEQQAVSVRRKLKHMYSVHGTMGDLERKLSRNSLSAFVRRSEEETIE